jgi:PAS domain S-box-containing protein
MLYAALSGALLTTVVNGMIIIASLWTVKEHSTLILWYICLLVVSLARFALSLRFKSSTIKDKNVYFWLYGFALGGALSACVWGATAIWLFPADDLPLQMLLAFILAGMAAGAISSLSYVKFLFHVYVLITLLPLTVSFFYSNSELSTLMAGLLLFFIVMLLAGAKRSHSYTFQNICLRMEATAHKEALQQSEKTYQSLFELSNDANLIVDKGSFVSCNQAALTMFGYSEKTEFLGKRLCNLSPLLQLDGSQSDEDAISKIEAASHEQKQLFEWEYVRQNGEVFSAEVLLSPIKYNGQQMLQMIIRDITQRKAVERDLLQSKQNAEQAYQVKSKFLSQMSHELRTPLNAVLGFGQLLQYNDDNLAEKQKLNVEQILSAGYHLLDLVNDVLDLSQIESGNMTLALEAVPLDTVLKECFVLIENQCAQHNIHLIDNISAQGFVVKADFTRLKQIMLNLLSNAVKYNVENGTIILDAKLSDQQHLDISVTDTGKGLSADQIAKLFTPFERLDAPMTIEGTGIGLSICKQLVEFMGGSIKVSSAHDAGCVFTIRLAIAKAIE